VATPCVTSETMPEASSPEQVLERVRVLSGRFHRQSSDAEVRRSISRELAELRRLWRRNSSLFLPDTLIMLKELAHALDRSPDAGTTAEPLSVLHQVFGFKEFRPGQQPIIESVLAGRDCLGI